ncbi:hypothetical protein SUGI_0007260 [Cryptomeria japonica]|nr:hypothetical protein SUGI_0007260 [Cryptomeria japonica]
MVEDPQFYEDRLRCGRSEEFICLLETVNHQFKSLPLVTIYDPINKLWEKLPTIPAEFEFCSSSKLICVKHKLVLLGLSQRNRAGSKRKRTETTKAILIFDFLSCKWRKGADMPTRECPANFGCCASPEGLIYLAGGRQNGEITGKATSQAAVYNVETNEWKLLPNMLQNQWLCDCVFIEGMMYVVCLYDEEVQQFEPETEVWSVLPNMWFIEDCMYPMVAAFGRLYCFQWDVVTEYDSRENLWRIVDGLPQPLDSVDAAVLGDRIFLSGVESGSKNHTFFYIYQLPLKTGVNRERWICVERPQYFSQSCIQSVATLVI